MLTTRVLVTGGAGLIGAYLLPKLIAKGFDVTVVDNLTRGDVKNIPANCKLIKADACDIPQLDLGAFDIVFHLASFMFGLGFSEKNHEILYEKNIQINNAMINLMKKQSSHCHVVFISSSCVYSDNGPDCVNEDTPLGIYPEMANIGYGFSKRHMEDCLRLASLLHGFRLSIVRPLNIYGERYRWVGEYSQAIPMLVNKIMTNNEVVVWGSGEQRRTYVHAEDCAELIYQIGIGAGIPVLNIGLEKTVSLNELTLLIAQLAKRDITIINDKSKPEGRFIKSASSENIFRHLPDFKFSISLKEGLARMIDWWHANLKNT